MNFFNLLDKGKKRKETTSDIDILSGTGIVKYIRSQLKNPSDENVLKVLDNMAKPAEDLNHLTDEGDFPWGWHTKNLPIVKPYEDAIVKISVDLKPLNGKERIVQLEKLILKYNEFKEFCYGKDECYIKYFSDMWEHCQNSRCDDFEYIAPYISELEELKKK